ncbi:uncharacterized protein TNCV_1531491 [Trichonephila clavipes]|nr:uncharacterized protein TNCV_1531491 [Trichonephila clavipes]
MHTSGAEGGFSHYAGPAGRRDCLHALQISTGYPASLFHSKISLLLDSHFPSGFSPIPLVLNDCSPPSCLNHSEVEVVFRKLCGGKAPVMSFLGKGKKADLIKLAIELGECESKGEELKIIELRTKISTNDAYKEDPEFVKCFFEGIVSNRIDEENKHKEQTLREFELQKI